MTFELEPKAKALLTYMEAESENRWAAGWMASLHEELLGDKAYEWLVSEVGGTFVYDANIHGPRFREAWIQNGKLIYGQAP